MTVDDEAIAVRSPQPTSSRRHAGLRLALLTALVSGVAIYVNGQAVRRFPSPTVYTTGKNLVAGVVLLAIMVAVTGRRHSDATPATPATSTTTSTPTTTARPLTRRQRLAVAGVAVGGGATAFVLFFEGLARATSTDAAFIHKTLVVWASCLAVWFLREHVGPAQAMAMVALVAGHIVLADGVGSLRPGTGELMILLATLIWSVEVVVVKRLLDDVSPSVMAAARVGGGSVVLVAWLVLTGDSGELVGFSAAQVGWLAVTGSLLAAFVTCWYQALARAFVVDVTAILVVGAVITGLIDVVIGHSPAGVRPPGWLLILVGAAVVVAHAFSTDRPTRRISSAAVS